MNYGKFGRNPHFMVGVDIGKKPVYADTLQGEIERDIINQLALQSPVNRLTDTQIKNALCGYAARQIESGNIVFGLAFIKESSHGLESYAAGNQELLDVLEKARKEGRRAQDDEDRRISENIKRVNY